MIASQQSATEIEESACPHAQARRIRKKLLYLRDKANKGSKLASIFELLLQSPYSHDGRRGSRTLNLFKGSDAIVTLQDLIELMKLSIVAKLDVTASKGINLRGNHQFW